MNRIKIQQRQQIKSEDNPYSDKKQIICSSQNNKKSIYENKQNPLTKKTNFTKRKKGVFY